MSTYTCKEIIKMFMDGRITEVDHGEIMQSLFDKYCEGHMDPDLVDASVVMENFPLDTTVDVKKDQFDVLDVRMRDIGSHKEWKESTLVFLSCVSFGKNLSRFIKKSFAQWKFDFGGFSNFHIVERYLVLVQQTQSELSHRDFLSLTLNAKKRSFIDELFRRVGAVITHIKLKLVETEEIVKIAEIALSDESGEHFVGFSRLLTHMTSRTVNKFPNVVRMVISKFIRNINSESTTFDHTSFAYYHDLLTMLSRQYTSYMGEFVDVGLKYGVWWLLCSIMSSYWGTMREKGVVEKLLNDERRVGVSWVELLSFYTEMMDEEEKKKSARMIFKKIDEDKFYGDSEQLFELLLRLNFWEVGMSHMLEKWMKGSKHSRWIEKLVYAFQEHFGSKIFEGFDISSVVDFCSRLLSGTQHGGALLKFIYDFHDSKTLIEGLSRDEDACRSVVSDIEKALTYPSRTYYGSDYAFRFAADISGYNKDLVFFESTENLDDKFSAFYKHRQYHLLTICVNTMPPPSDDFVDYLRCCTTCEKTSAPARRLLMKYSYLCGYEIEEERSVHADWAYYFDEENEERVTKRRRERTDGPVMQVRVHVKDDERVLVFTGPSVFFYNNSALVRDAYDKDPKTTLVLHAKKRKKMSTKWWISYFERRMVAKPKFTFETFGDVTFITSDGHYVKSHRLFLSRSQYFEKMFSTGWKENETHVLKFEGPMSTLKLFLKCVYDDELYTEYEDEVVQLMVYFDMYRFMHLKEKCEGYLCRFIDKDNAQKYLDIAETFQCPIIHTVCTYLYIK